MESATAEQAPSIRRLIVPPGHDVPIKQTMVDIFAKTREPPKDAGHGLGGVAADRSEQPMIATQHGNGGSGVVAATGGEQPIAPQDGADQLAEGSKPTVPIPEKHEPTAAEDGTLSTPTCEEQALKLIEKLEDGPTKQALMSLCEASLVKVGLMGKPYKLIGRLDQAISLNPFPAFFSLLQATPAVSVLAPDVGAATSALRRADTSQLQANPL